MSFEKFKLIPEILISIQAKGYKQPTPIQQQAIPLIMKGHDILARAQTGTGKTAAFTLPVLHRLMSNPTHTHRKNQPRALILTPTRELAAQVGKNIQAYGQGVGLSSTVVFGGVGINHQIKCLRAGVDIVTGTPGRLIDLLNRQDLDLSHIEILILDEADRMLDMGFIHDIRKIINAVPNQRQTLFFSATYSNAIKKLAEAILYKPEIIEISKHNTAAELVQQCAYYVPRQRKSELLIHLIKSDKWQQVLVFTRTKEGASVLARKLAENCIKAAAIHGDKSQSARTRALNDFKTGKHSVLVATDVAARGLDIIQLPHVVNYELPNIPEDYIHRIGRTGRAGCPGEAVSLVSPSEVKYLKAIEQLLKKSIYVKRNEEFENNTKGCNRRTGQQNNRSKKKNKNPWGRSKKSKHRLTRAQRKSIL